MPSRSSTAPAPRRKRRVAEPRTAALFKKPSQALKEAINHGRIVAVTAPGFVEMQVGLPIVVDGEVICAIGASFDTPDSAAADRDQDPAE